jgi:hypothetical protein
MALIANKLLIIVSLLTIISLTKSNANNETHNEPDYGNID